MQKMMRRPLLERLIFRMQSYRKKMPRKLLRKPNTNKKKPNNSERKELFKRKYLKRKCKKLMIEQKKTASMRVKLSSTKSKLKLNNI